MKLHSIIPAVALVAILSGCGSTASSTSPVSPTDTTPPPAVTGITMLTNARTGNSILLWDASAAPDVASYQVFGADNNQYHLMGTTSATQYQIPASSAGSAFAVRAVDDAGNASPYALYTVGSSDDIQ